MSEIELIKEPSLKEAYELLKQWVNLNKVILIAAECSINYVGRASSRLTSGERIIVIKRDGALLVHRPWGYEPVNWQPSGSATRVSMKKSCILLESIRRKPSERLEINMSRVLLLLLLDMRDEGKFSMYGEEEELREVIASNPDIVERGLRVLKEEKRLGGRRVDLLCVDRKGRLVVIELKNEVAGREAVSQLKSYVKQLKRETGREDVRGILVAPKVAKGVKPLLIKSGLELRTIDPNKLRKYHTLLDSL